MMGKYEFLQFIRKGIFIGKDYSIRDMTDDVLGTLLYRKICMVLNQRILIFGETLGIGYLSDIMVQGTSPDKRYIGINCTGSGICKIHHLKRMLEGTGGLVCKQAEQRVGRVTEFHKLRIGHKAEYLLEKINQRIAGNSHQGSECHVQNLVVIIEILESS